MINRSKIADLKSTSWHRTRGLSPSSLHSLHFSVQAPTSKSNQSAGHGTRVTASSFSEIYRIGAIIPCFFTNIHEELNLKGKDFPNGFALARNRLVPVPQNTTK